jgi:hypothetical protein
LSLHPRGKILTMSFKSQVCLRCWRENCARNLTAVVLSISLPLLCWMNILLGAIYPVQHTWTETLC